MSPLASLPPEIARRRVLKTKDAATFLGVSVKSLTRMRDRLPNRIPLSESRFGYRIGDLMDWQDCRETGREWKDCRGAQSAR